MRRMVKRTEGSVAVELGLVAPILLIVTLGVVDFGWAFVEMTATNAAAQAGAGYALTNGFNAAGIAAAVTAGTSLGGITATPAPHETCGCPSSSGVTASQPTTPPCTGKCTGGQTAGAYAVVSATASFTPLLNWPLSPKSFSSEVAVRLQ